jgi:hypothetical protein
MFAAGLIDFVIALASLGTLFLEHKTRNQANAE